MTRPSRVLLDEHASRIFERLLTDHGIEVVHAKDEFGTRTRKDSRERSKKCSIGTNLKLYRIRSWR
jgi:hypothetical protein